MIENEAEVLLCDILASHQSTEKLNSSLNHV